MSTHEQTVMTRRFIIGHGVDSADGVRRVTLVPVVGHESETECIARSSAPGEAVTSEPLAA